MAKHDKLAKIIVKFVKKMRSRQRGLNLEEMIFFVGLNSHLPQATVARMTQLALNTGVKKGIYYYDPELRVYKLAHIDKPHVIKRHIVTPRASKSPKPRKPRAPRRPRPRRPRPTWHLRSPDFPLPNPHNSY